MEELVFEGDFKATLLTDELFDAFPDWTYEREYDFGLSNATDVVILHKPGIFIVRGPPEMLDKKKVAAIVNKHDPSKLSKSEKYKKDKKDKKDAVIAKLKEATGLTDDEIELLLER